MARRRSKSKQSRKINIAKIRPTHTYNLKELAKSQGRAIETVWRWRREGMPTIPGTKGQLVDGADLRVWAIARGMARKHPCKPDEFFCMSGQCRTQRQPAMGSVIIRKTNTNLGSVEGNCAVCGQKIKKGFAMAELAQTETALGAFVGNVHDLARYRDAPSNGKS